MLFSEVISVMENTITESNGKKDFQHTSVFRGCRPNIVDNPLVSSTLCMFGLFTGMSPLSVNFPYNIQIVLLLLYSNKCCKAY